MLAAVLSGLAFGLVNLAHCAGMCGPLAAASCGRTGRSGLVRYQLGRSLAYSYAGGLAGQLGGSLTRIDTSWMRAAFPLLTAVACGLAAKNLWARAPHSGLVQLRVAPRPRRGWFARVRELIPADPLPLGLLSVLLPCGLLAAALLAAVATGSGSTGAAFMLGFAVASGGALAGAGLLAQRALGWSFATRRVLACALLVGALLFAVKPLAALSGSQPHTQTHSCH